MVKTRSELVYKGMKNIQPAYEPNGRILQQGIDKRYIKNKNIKVYNPELFPSDWEKSELRRVQILANIRAIRAEMKDIAMSRIKVSATQIKQPIPYKVREALSTLEVISNFTEKLFSTKVHIALQSIREYQN